MPKYVAADRGGTTRAACAAEGVERSGGHRRQRRNRRCATRVGHDHDSKSLTRQQQMSALAGGNLPLLHRRPMPPFHALRAVDEVSSLGRRPRRSRFWAIWTWEEDWKRCTLAFPARLTSSMAGDATKPIFGRATSKTWGCGQWRQKGQSHDWKLQGQCLRSSCLCDVVKVADWRTRVACWARAGFAVAVRDGGGRRRTLGGRSGRGRRCGGGSGGGGGSMVVGGQGGVVRGCIRRRRHRPVDGSRGRAGGVVAQGRHQDNPCLSVP